MLTIFILLGAGCFGPLYSLGSLMLSDLMHCHCDKPNHCQATLLASWYANDVSWSHDC